MHNGTSYLLTQHIPSSYHRGSDLVLATALVSGHFFWSDWVSDINPWIAFIGGMLGVFIAIVRSYEIVRDFFRGKKDAGEGQ